MSGQPPVTPPSLSYKSKAQREREEAERREREEAERREREEAERQAREQYEARMAEARKREEVDRARASQAKPSIPGPREEEPPVAVPAPAASQPQVDNSPRISEADPKSLVMFEEDGLAPGRREIDDIEMLGGSEEEMEEEAPEEAPEEVKAPMRRPPRPPKSPDMRPVYTGFILVATGLVQFAYGLITMVGSPDAGSGPWSPIVRWGTFSMGLSAAFLGLVAVRGGLWSFRKERFSVVKAGAIAATVCVWAWWVPWVFGALALVLVTRARDEYYPFYDPRWDAPEHARPPPSEEGEGDEEKEDEGDGSEGEEEDGARGGPADARARDYLEDVSPPDDKEASGLQDADTSPGDGWEDLA